VAKRIMSVFSSKLKAQKALKQLIRQGIPPELRGDIWWACSGGAQKMQETSTMGQFGSLVQRSSELDGTKFEIDIEKDLKRTFPSHPWFGSPEGGWVGWDRSVYELKEYRC